MIKLYNGDVVTILKGGDIIVFDQKNFLLTIIRPTADKSDTRLRWGASRDDKRFFYFIHNYEEFRGVCKLMLDICNLELEKFELKGEIFRCYIEKQKQCCGCGGKLNENISIGIEHDLPSSSFPCGECGLLHLTDTNTPRIVLNKQKERAHLINNEIVHKS